MYVFYIYKILHERMITMKSRANAASIQKIEEHISKIDIDTNEFLKCETLDCTGCKDGNCTGSNHDL